MSINSRKCYLLEHLDSGWEGVVRIDHAVADPFIKDCVEFWSGWESEHSACDDDYTITFLKKLGVMLTLMQLSVGYNLSGVIDQLRACEGWPPLDGSYGITLSQCDSAVIDIDAIIAREIPERERSAGGDDDN